MSNGLLDEIDELLGGDELPERVSNRLIFAAQQELLREVREVKHELHSMKESNSRLEARVAALEQVNQESPSLLWLLKHQSRSTISTLILLLLLWNLAVLYMGPILYKLVGLSVP